MRLNSRELKSRIKRPFEQFFIQSLGIKNFEIEPLENRERIEISELEKKIIVERLIELIYFDPDFSDEELIAQLKQIVNLPVRFPQPDLSSCRKLVGRLNELFDRDRYPSLEKRKLAGDVEIKSVSGQSCNLVIEGGFYESRDSIVFLRPFEYKTALVEILIDAAIYKRYKEELTSEAATDGIRIIGLDFELELISDESLLDEAVEIFREAHLKPVPTSFIDYVNSSGDISRSIESLRSRLSRRSVLLEPYILNAEIELVDKLHSFYDRLLSEVNRSTLC